MIISSLQRGAGLAAGVGLLLVLTACDSNDAMDDSASPFDGQWRGTVPVEWTRTYALPAGASADSVRYDHVGVHVMGVTLRPQGGRLRGTVDWNRQGTYTRTTYDGGSVVVDQDDIVYDEAPVSATATRTGNTLTFAPGDNDWITGTRPVELTLRDGRLHGELLHTYLVQTWPVPNGSPTQVETRLEVPIVVQLERAGR